MRAPGRREAARRGPGRSDERAVRSNGRGRGSERWPGCRGQPGAAPSGGAGAGRWVAGGAAASGVRGPGGGRCTTLEKRDSENDSTTLRPCPAPDGQFCPRNRPPAAGRPVRSLSPCGARRLTEPPPTGPGGTERATPRGRCAAAPYASGCAAAGPAGRRVRPRPAASPARGAVGRGGRGRPPPGRVNGEHHSANPRHLRPRWRGAVMEGRSGNETEMRAQHSCPTDRAAYITL